MMIVIQYVYIDLRYDIDNTNLKVDIFKGEPTYGDFGDSTLQDEIVAVVRTRLDKALKELEDL